MTIKNKVLETLAQIKKDNHVEVLYAAEVGSRTYKYESSYSDYDVKFIYVRPIDWYLHLNVEHKSDTITKVVDNLDLVGWDLKKVFKLLVKSNTSLIEWFNSDKVYLREACLNPVLVRDLINMYYRLPSGVYHYMGMAMTDLKKIEGYKEVPLKKYVNIVRCLLAAVKIVKMKCFPDLDPLTGIGTATNDVRMVYDSLLSLFAQKRQSTDRNKMVPRSDIIDQFITDSLTKLKHFDEKPNKNKDVTNINEVFRVIVNNSGLN